MIDPVISESSKNTQHPLEVGTILLIDKPAGWTSFDVVNKIRGSIKHHLGLKKIKGFRRVEEIGWSYVTKLIKN